MQAICSKILNKTKRPAVVISGEPEGVAEAVVGYNTQAGGQLNTRFRCDDAEWPAFRAVCSFLGATVPDSARIVEPQPGEIADGEKAEERSDV